MAAEQRLSEGVESCTGWTDAFRNTKGDMNGSTQRQENRTQTLLRGLQSSGLCVIYHDAEMAVRLVENLPPSWPSAEAILAAGDAAVFDPFTAERVLAVKREVLARGQSQRIEAPQRRDGQDLLWFELSIEQDADPEGGAPRGLFVSVTDITQIKRREATLRDLLFEVSHRSRNMLAILQSILGQTADHAASIAEFEEKFRGRIACLAQSQDLITYANWQGVRFRRLVETQIGPFLEDLTDMPSMEGGDPLLSPNTALHLGLALHELAANSHSYGVLGQGAGRLLVRAGPAEASYRIEWIEEPAPGAPAPGKEGGFGRTVLEVVVPRALRARAAYSLDAEGVRYVLDLPDLVEEDAPITQDRVRMMRFHA